MKKVLILTFSKVYNRGANLQCYALKSILENQGFDVKFLDVALKSVGQNLRGIIWSYFVNYKSNKFRKDQKFRFTKTYHGLDELKKDVPQADYYIVGSDQVWNPEITKNTDPRIYFFTFLPETTNRISYAASFGRDEWVSGSYDNEIIKSLSTFKAVSVREDTGCQICKDTFGISNPNLVLDPTLLLTQSNVYELIKTNINSKNHIFKYLLYSSSAVETMANDISELLQLKIKGNDKSKIFRKFKAAFSIQTWLKNIAESEFVVTNSFHCMVFCILLHKRFAAIPPHSGRETRITSLLSLLHLEYRYFSSIEDLHKRQSELSITINYDEVDKILIKERNKSLKFLLEALS